MKNKGFSLVELMIAMTLLAIIMSYGYRSFSDSRANVEAEIDRQSVFRTSVLLEQYFSYNRQYPDRLSDILSTNRSTILTPKGYYFLFYTRVSARDYLLTAKLNRRKPGAGHIECHEMSINAAGKLTGYNQAGKPAGHVCWK